MTTHFPLLLNLSVCISCFQLLRSFNILLCPMRRSYVDEIAEMIVKIFTEEEGSTSRLILD